MFLPSKKTLAALDAVVIVACEAGGLPVSSTALSEMLGVPKRYLEPLMQKLVQGDILHSIRGPRGGYVLARERRKITIADLLEVLAREAEEGIVPGSPWYVLWQDVQTAVTATLANLTLDEVCQRTGSGSSNTSDFTI